MPAEEGSARARLAEWQKTSEKVQMPWCRASCLVLWVLPFWVAGCDDSHTPETRDRLDAAARSGANVASSADGGLDAGLSATPAPGDPLGAPSADASVVAQGETGSDAGPARRPVTGTFGGGLVLTDAAIAALAALTPEERARQQARCESGPVDSGIGLSCTPRGGECPSGLACTANFRGDSGICTRLGCGIEPGDCGAGASCCTLLQSGGVSLCFPDDCLPSTCLELFQ